MDSKSKPVNAPLINQESLPIATANENPPSTIKRVGVIGGGQLAWMMAGAAQSLGLELVVQTAQSTDPAVEIASDTIIAPIDDATATARLAACCDVITFENEFINLNALIPLAQQGFASALAWKPYLRCWISITSALI